VEADNVVEAKDNIIRVDCCVSTFPDVPNGEGGEAVATAMVVWITEGSKVKAAKAILDSLTAAALNCARSIGVGRIPRVRRRRINFRTHPERWWTIAGGE
jgi:hypothetical protein